MAVASANAVVEPSRERSLWPLAALSACAAGAAAVLSLVDPTRPGSLLPGCPVHALTGLYCPGCGSTRALHALLRGDVPMALSMNPLLVLSLPFVTLMALSAAGLLPRSLDPLMRVLGDARIWLVLLVGYAVLRNLPWFPFTALAPG